MKCHFCFCIILTNFSKIIGLKLKILKLYAKSVVEKKIIGKNVF